MSMDSDSDESLYDMRPNSSRRDAYGFEVKRYDIFLQQDPENGNFDVTLDFSGKKLYLHKFMVMSVSETLNSMLSDRWSKGEKIIKIENYGYDDFFQFACFLYSCNCKLTNDNIFQMTDIAEFYGVQALKNKCEAFLIEMPINAENIYDLLEFGEQYSLKRFNQILRDNFLIMFDELMNAEKFLTLRKSTVLFVASLKQINRHTESMFFTAVCKWAKHQVSIKKKCSVDDANCLGEDVKAELVDIIPYIKFTVMRYPFVSTFIDKILKFICDLLSPSTRRYKHIHQQNHAISLQVLLLFMNYILVENKYLFTQSELYNILMGSARWNQEEEDMFKLIYGLAEKQVQQHILGTDENDSLHEAIAAELAEVIPRVQFSLMTLSFLKEFLADKKFLFSPSELYKVFAECIRFDDSEEEELFKIVYGLAETEAAEKQKASDNKSFKLHEAIKNELTDVLDSFHYSRMSLDFVVEFLAPKTFLFPLKKIFPILMDVRKYDEEEKLFDTIYEIAVNDATEKQLSAYDDEFNFRGTIKEVLAEILHQVQFSRMRLEYVVEEIAGKRFLFTASDSYRHLSNAKRTDAQEEEFFQAIYELAQKNVREKQEINKVTNFNLKAAVKEELSEVIPSVKFAEMKIEFLTNFAVKYGFTFGSADLFKFYSRGRKDYGNEEQLFKAIYILAERQATEKKKIFSNPENFNLVETIKTDLASTLPNVPFYQMSKEFLYDFVVKNEILSLDEALHVFDFRIVIENNNRSVTGAFVDTFGVEETLGPDGYILNARGQSQQRFTKLKFNIPTTPSPVQKMRGVRWYLVLEKDGIMALKGYWNVTRSDYILAEMKSQNDEFEITKGHSTSVKPYFKRKA